MRIKASFVPLALATLMLAAPLGANADATVVGVDDPGDWGQGTDPDADPFLAALGEPLGQDLISAAIEVDGDTVNFIIGVTALPENGGAPEVSRYTWNALVDGEFFELDGKYTNYSRGACDPTAGSCPPPRDPGEAPFTVRGNCSETGTITLCEELALVHADFDPETDTITIPVPADVVGGCVITAGPNLFGSTRGGEAVSVAPSAFFTSSAMPMDLLFIDGTATVC